MSTETPQGNGGGQPYAALMRWGGHMLRARISHGGTSEASSLVGLGVFPPQGNMVGREYCCTPTCHADTDLLAAWLRNGMIAVLPFCRPCADEHLLVDEVVEVHARLGQKQRATRKDAMEEVSPCRS